MRYFSMFSGIGGFEIGIERATNKDNWKYISEQTRSRSNIRHEGDITNNQMQRTKTEQQEHCSKDNNWRCDGFSEIDKHAIRVYQHHFPDHKNYGNATAINPDDLPDFDMLCGGFPCQSFSIAGKRQGFKDTRGTLFHEILRIAKAKRPRLLFLENVKGLLSADNGRCFSTIISSLDELGYNCEWQILNSKNWGVPQNRERVFIIGHLRGTSSRQVFPIGEGNEETAQDYAYCLDSNYSKGCNDFRKKNRTVLFQLNENVADAFRVYSIQGVSKTLKGLGGGQGAKTGLYAVPLTTRRTDEAKKIRSENLKKGVDYNPKSMRKIELRDDGIMQAITANWDIEQSVFENSRIRRLTPVECERLQGFPDDYTNLLSDSQRYRCLGNAVTTNVIEAIVRKMIENEMSKLQ